MCSEFVVLSALCWWVWCAWKTLEWVTEWLEKEYKAGKKAREEWRKRHQS